MAFSFGKRSLERLKGVHPDLVKVMKRAIGCSTIDFTVLEGVRTLETQKKYYAAGATRTMNSRHLTGHAVDIAPIIDGKVRWDWPLYHQIAKVVDKAAEEEGVKLTWGGRWRTFKDGPHWELDWKAYPAGSKK
jgi:peptidoglycan L-alanyl-D-glutamate endopeptidase CwlK